MTKNTGLGTVVPRLKIIIYSVLALVFAAALVLAGCRASPVDEFEGDTNESGDAAAIVIVKQPQSPDKAYLVNDPSIAPLVVKAAITGGNGQDTLQYQWYSQTGDNDPQEIPESEGGTSDTYTPPDDAPGMTQYLVEVIAVNETGAGDEQIIPAFSAPACIWVVGDEDSVIISISGGSINSDAYLSNYETNTRIPLKSTDPGWEAYSLEPGVWTLKNYAPAGKVVNLSPSSGTINAKTGEPQYLAVTISDAADTGGTVVVSTSAGTALPNDANLTRNGSKDVPVANGGGTYAGLTPGVWTLDGLSQDGSLTTNPNPPTVNVSAGETSLITVSSVSVPAAPTTGTIIVCADNPLPEGTNATLEGPGPTVNVGINGGTYSELAPGVWSLRGLPGTAITNPNPADIYLEAGATELFAVKMGTAPPETGTISLNVIGVVGVLPDGATLVGPDNTQISAAGGSKTYYGLKPGVWALSNLPSDGSVTTSPNPPVVYVAAGNTKVIGAIVNIADTDSDDDGYSDDWEKSHADDGFNVTIPNKPYGIDLSHDGAIPPGVTWTLGTSTYTVQPSYDGSSTEYRVYHSTPGKNVAAKLDVAAGAKTNLLLDNATLSGGITVNNRADLSLSSVGTNSLGINIPANANVNITLNNMVVPDVITVNNGARLTLHSAAGEDQPNVRIPNGANATVVLDGVQFTGANPIDVLPGGNLTLLLTGINTVTANSTAGIHVPAGAELVIDSAASGNAGTEQSSHATSGTLTVTGGSTGGAGAGIGGSMSEAGGAINIIGGTVNAVGGTGGATWGAAAGTGGGGDLDSVGAGNGRGNAGTIVITGGLVNATGGSTGAGIGGGAYASNTTGSITITGGTINAAARGSGAGIGGGNNGAGGTIAISGSAVVYAYTPGGTGDPAAIGGGAFGRTGDVSISGGAVAAIVGNGASPSIGGGAGATGGSISISGGTIIANSKIGIGNAAGYTTVTNIVNAVVFATAVRNSAGDGNIGSSNGIFANSEAEVTPTSYSIPNPATRGTIALGADILQSVKASTRLPLGWEFISKD